MKIGLFDLYTNGHHLPYAARLKEAIESTSDFEVKFITLAESKRCKDLFGPEDILYLDHKNRHTVEERSEKFDHIADEQINKFFYNLDRYDFDVIHFLFADDILGPLYRHEKEQKGVRLIGELNGIFFERKSLVRQPLIHPLLLSLLGSPAGDLLDTIVPELTKHEQLWRDLFLYRSLKSQTFDHIVIHSDEAYQYVSDIDKHDNTPLEHIPYPAPQQFGFEMNQSVARNALNLPDIGPILLYFGTLRKEKGVNQLIRVLGHYQGPEFTMHIAGPPIDVSPEQIAEIGQSSSIDIIAELEYIDDPVPYYRSADAIILPYPREFGEECTSQTLEEASSSMLPVIVPDFGVIGRVTSEWNLGMTYEPESDAALENAIKTFARDGVSFSEKRVKMYNQLHSYEQAAKRLVGVYEA